MIETEPTPPPFQLEDTSAAEEVPAADQDRPCPCCGRELIEDQLPEGVFTDAPEGITNTVLVCSDVTGCGFYEY